MLIELHGSRSRVVFAAWSALRRVQLEYLQKVHLHLGSVTATALRPRLPSKATDLDELPDALEIDDAEDDLNVDGETVATL